jgi:hypothetical protein
MFYISRSRSILFSPGSLSFPLLKIELTVKPETPAAMQQLIRQVREALPFGTPQGYVCADECRGCSLKLLEFLDLELMDWEDRLQQGEVPDLGDVQRMAKISRKVHPVLERNGAINR